MSVRGSQSTGDWGAAIISIDLAAYAFFIQSCRPNRQRPSRGSLHQKGSARVNRKKNTFYRNSSLRVKFHDRIAECAAFDDETWQKGPTNITVRTKLKQLLHLHGFACCWLPDCDTHHYSLWSRRGALVGASLCNCQRRTTLRLNCCAPYSSE